MGTVIDRGRRLAAADSRSEIQVREIKQLRQHATDLFNQQCWCWGRDVLRTEGNWLRELGFEQFKPSAERKECSSSVYQLSLSGGRCVVLRGFGAFFGDRDLGGVFLSRNKFALHYLSEATLECPPWSDSDLPPFQPICDENRECYAKLTLNLIDWIYEYEMDVIAHLGLPYREETLLTWNNRKRTTIPAEQFATSWRELSLRISENKDVFFHMMSL